MTVKVIKSGRRGDIKGEVKTASREVRLSALKGLEALPALTRVALIYSLLYDSDTRVRAVARKELLTLPNETLTAFIEEAGHPKILDFLIRNLPKTSTALPILASAPGLAHRTKQFVKSSGITAAPQSATPKRQTEDAADQAAANAKPGEGAIDIDLEWKPPSDDFELPEGVEFEMPFEEDDQKTAKSTADLRDQGDTAPVLPKLQKPFPKPPPVTKPAPVPIKSEEEAKPTPTAPPQEPVAEAKSMDADESLPMPTPIEIEYEQQAEPVVEKIPEPAPVAPVEKVPVEAISESPPPAPSVELSPEPKVSEPVIAKGDAIVPPPPQEEKPAPAPSVTVVAPELPAPDALFPQFEKPKAAPAPVPVDRIRPSSEARPIQTVGPMAGGTSLRKTFMHGLLLGVLVAAFLIGGYFVITEFFPGIMSKIKGSGAQPHETIPPNGNQQPVNPVTPTQPAHPSQPIEGKINIMLGVYRTPGSLHEAERKAQKLGLETDYTRKEDDQTTYSVSVGAADAEDAQRKASGIRSLGIPASPGERSIYCGSFSSQEDANKRAIALRASGYSAHVSQRENKKTTFTLKAKNVPAEKEDQIIEQLKNEGFKPRVM